ncbi:transcriptional regulator [Candidatus Saccharibacteria bacterium CG_4_10_14_0_2_um_filter_52_9]|nr:MAG: transcriptional regulator [Candidatus Saccharibacteria bacterium CG_4_10_14_0_2_um_filter_52_9]
MKTTKATTNTWDKYEKKLLKKHGVRKALKESELEYEIARAVIEARLNRGLTQKQLADALHTKQSVISRVENAKTTPSLAFLKRLAGVLGYSLKVQLKA